MTEIATSPERARLLARGLWLEYLTVGWNVVEGLVAIGAGMLAGSIALIGFGVDSAVETVSGGVLVWRLRSEARGTLDEEAVERVERRARTGGSSRWRSVGSRSRSSRCSVCSAGLGFVLSPLWFAGAAALLRERTEGQETTEDPMAASAGPGR